LGYSDLAESGTLLFFHTAHGGFAMKKVYIVRLSDEERETCLVIVKKLKGTSTKVRRANILLKADADGPKWKDKQIADAFLCTRTCIENLRKRLVTEGFEVALHGKKRQTPSRRKILRGEQEAKVIALRLSDPPKGCNANKKGVNWQFTTENARIKLESLYPKFLC